MPTEPAVPTLFDVVHRAAQVCDPGADNDGVAQLLARFEDRDEPVTGLADPEQTILEEKGAIDPQDEDPAVTMAASVAIYLAFRREELGDRPEILLRLAARAEYDGAPPDLVVGWLADQGVEL